MQLEFFPLCTSWVKIQSSLHFTKHSADPYSSQTLLLMFHKGMWNIKKISKLSSHLDPQMCLHIWKGKKQSDSSFAMRALKVGLSQGRKTHLKNNQDLKWPDSTEIFFCRNLGDNTPESGPFPGRVGKLSLITDGEDSHKLNVIK